MRVISENRTIDVPYERSIICYHGVFRQIRADCYGNGDSAVEYVLKRNVESDEAEKILSEIRDAYSMGRKYIIL